MRDSERARKEAAKKAGRAEEKVGEMASILRRIAEAVERNPQTWDDLFDGRRRR